MGITLAAAPAQAISLVDTEHFTLDLGGYARALSGVQRLRLRVDPALPAPDLDPSGLHAGVGRFQWTSAIGGRAHVELHNRFSWTLQSAAADPGGQRLGLGVSRVPERTVDTRTVLVDSGDGRFALQHDIDRFAVRLGIDQVEVVVGRQAVSWGYSSIFLVADLWTNFSPFELDLSQKPGIDAARVIAQFEGVEIDVIVAGRQTFEAIAEGRGDWTHLSAGARATFYLPFGDVYGAIAKHWDLAMIHAGVSAALDVLTLRAEVSQSYDTSRARFDLPRATVGVDLFAPDLNVTIEAHFNGVGAPGLDAYLTDERSLEAVGRGETYLLGRGYLGTAIAYRPWELLSLGFSALGNLGDGSVMVAGTATYSPSENLEVTLGAFRGFGEAPEIRPGGLRLGGEYGAYGALYYVQMAAFF